MLNLQQIADAVTSAINPDVTAELWKSIGSVTSPSGQRTPSYRKLPIAVQVQSLTYSDLMQLDGLSIQGVRRAIYASTQVAAIIRVLQKGGDLIVFPNGTLPEGTTWLAAHVLERWSSWNKIAITLQIDQLEAFACE